MLPTLKSDVIYGRSQRVIFTVHSLIYASPGFSLFNSEGELAWVRTENCLLAPIKFGELLTLAPTKFVTSSYVSTHELKLLTQ